MSFPAQLSENNAQLGNKPGRKHKKPYGWISKGKDGFEEVDRNVLRERYWIDQKIDAACQRDLTRQAQQVAFYDWELTAL